MRSLSLSLKCEKATSTSEEGGMERLFFLTIELSIYLQQE